MSNDLDELRIVLIGKTGSGKSSTANTITGEKQFDEALSFDSQTGTMKRVTVKRFDMKLIVVDTPGLYDTQDTVTSNDTLREIKMAFVNLSPGPHAIILVLKGNARYGNPDRDIANLFHQYLGKEMLSHFFVIFCGRDEIESKGGDINTLLKKSTNEELKTLIESCKGRYFCFDNTSEDEYQVKQLIDKINENVRLNGGKHYSSKLFKDIEKAIAKEGITHEEVSGGFRNTSKKVLKILSAPIWGPFYYIGKWTNMF